jgi:DNA-binding MarR family transcriptional regulator
MKYECLNIKNQLCFPLYAVSHKVTKRYKPYLDELDLTYTQYITMMVLWDQEKISVKDLGKQLHLDSGTLTPLLKRLEKKGLITRQRYKDDERVLIVSITKEGMDLQEKAHTIPERIGACLPLSKEESLQLYHLLYKILDDMEEE